MTQRDNNKGRFEIGQAVSVKRTFTQRDFDVFAALSGDDNPIHVDPDFSAHTKFGRTVAHGMLLYATIEAVLGNNLPGPGALPHEQELIFPSPTYTEEEVTIRLEVSDILPKSGQVELKSTITRPNQELSCEGRTLVSQFPSFQASVSSSTLGEGLIKSDTQAWKGMSVGQRASSQRAFTSNDLHALTELTGNINPIHVDPEYARSFGFNEPLLPGSLLGGMVSDLLGTRLPGRGTNWLKQKYNFILPAYPGEEITAWVEIVRLRPEKDLVNLRTWCIKNENQVLCDGMALVLVKDLENRANSP